MSTFFKDFYADWRDKTGSGYFTLFFLSSLVLWNWRAVLILFASDLKTVEKLEKIDAVTGPTRSFAYPAATAILVCLSFAGLHAVLSYLISRIEFWRKSVLARQTARIRSARRTADAEEEADYQSLRRAALDTRGKNAEKEREVVEKEAQLHNSIDAINVTYDNNTRRLDANRMLLNLARTDGQATVTSQLGLLTQIKGDNIELSPKSHRERQTHQNALNQLANDGRIRIYGDPQSDEYRISISSIGYSHLDRMEKQRTNKGQSRPPDLTPETDPPSDP